MTPPPPHNNKSGTPYPIPDNRQPSCETILFQVHPQKEDHYLTFRIPQDQKGADTIWVFSLLSWSLRSLSSTLSLPSLGKWPTEVPTLKSWRLCFPLHISTWKDFYQNAQYWKQTRYRTIKHTVCRWVCGHISAQKFHRQWQWRGSQPQNLSWWSLFLSNSAIQHSLPVALSIH